MLPRCGTQFIAQQINVQVICFEQMISTSEYSVLLFSGLQPLVKIYKEFDIHSDGISSFFLSLKSFRVTGLDGKVLVKNPNGASNAWKYFGFWKIRNKVSKDLAVYFHFTFLDGQMSEYLRRIGLEYSNIILVLVRSLLTRFHASHTHTCT